MHKRGDGRGRLHRIWKPGMKWELCRLQQGPGYQKYANPANATGRRSAGLYGFCLREELLEAPCPEAVPGDGKDTQHTGIADSADNKLLLCRDCRPGSFLTKNEKLMQAQARRHPRKGKEE